MGGFGKNNELYRDVEFLCLLITTLGVGTCQKQQRRDPARPETFSKMNSETKLSHWYCFAEAQQQKVGAFFQKRNIDEVVARRNMFSESDSSESHKFKSLGLIGAKCTRNSVGSRVN